MLKYKKNLTLSQGGPDIGLKVGILAEIGYMLHECALYLFCKICLVLGDIQLTLQWVLPSSLQMAMLNLP